VRRLTPYVLLGVLTLGTGLGIGLGLSEAPTSTSVWQFFPAIPSGWKAVSYSGIVLDVPHTWVVSTWKDPCGPYVPTVLLGPEPTAFLKGRCPANMSGAAEVNIGARQMPGVTHEAVINGDRVRISFSNTKETYGSVETSVDQVIVHIDNVWIWIEVGTSTFLAGGAPGRAMQIVRTIHIE
jgi:hypothetical protein